MFSLARIIFFLVLSPMLAGASGVIPGDSARQIFHIDLNAALILNKSFSHYQETEANFGHAPAYLRLTGLPSPQYLPGFQVGISPVFLCGKRSSLVFNIAYSQTRATYRREDYERFQPGPDNIYTTEFYDETVKIVFSYLNFGFGWRVRVAGPLSLQASVLAGVNLNILESREGTLLTTEQEYYVIRPPGSPPPYYAEHTALTSTTMRYRGESHASARISLYCRLLTKPKFQTELFLYRNFSAVYSLPWWGIGATVRIW